MKRSCNVSAFCAALLVLTLLGGCAAVLPTAQSVRDAFPTPITVCLTQDLDRTAPRLHAHWTPQHGRPAGTSLLLLPIGGVFVPITTQHGPTSVLLDKGESVTSIMVMQSNGEVAMLADVTTNGNCRSQVDLRAGLGTWSFTIRKYSDWLTETDKASGN